MYDYDMVVIGSGPAGHHGAIQAAKLGKKIAVSIPQIFFVLRSQDRQILII